MTRRWTNTPTGNEIPAIDIDCVTGDTLQEQLEDISRNCSLISVVCDSDGCIVDASVLVDDTVCYIKKEAC